MGIKDTGINKSAIGALARKTIAKGIFHEFAEDFSKHTSPGLDGLKRDIISAEKYEHNDELTK